jgi:hypothetical protein
MFESILSITFFKLYLQWRLYPQSHWKINPNTLQYRRILLGNVMLVCTIVSGNLSIKTYNNLTTISCP